MKSKIYSMPIHEGVIKRHDVDSGFCDHRISSGISGGRADHAGKLFGMGYTTSEINALYANLWQDGFMLTGLAVAATAALFNGISQFWYLYSPRKIDFYHSLPVKRSRMFWHKTLQSLFVLFASISGNGIFSPSASGQWRVFSASS